MKTLKIWFADFWPEIIYEDIFTPILSKYYNIVLDEKNPDVIFHSIFNGMKDINKYPNIKKILWIAENYRANQFKTDYTISFDNHSTTNFRLPLWQAYLIKNPDLKDKLYTDKNKKDVIFNRFCSFTVSNGNNFIRNSIYNSLNSYKRVHSYGKYMTNDFSLQRINSNNKYWRDIKYDYFINNTHKYSLCYENSSHPLYCTEKLMDGFLGNSLPIYWGDSKAVNDFNERSFINVHQLMLTGSSVLDVIKKIDNSDNMFLDLYNEPVFTSEQKNKLENNLAIFEEWLVDVINK